MTTQPKPCIVIAAPHSGSGKTTLSCGLMASLARTHTVQAFKCGPDYIDPAYHAVATGRPSRNLDTWLMPHHAVRQTYSRAMVDADIAIIEGVMGLYDGYDALTEAGSTAEIAKLLGAPVILVIDVGKMARSAGAIALGCQQFDRDLTIGGVICNNVASDTHARWVREAIESIGIPVLGCVPRTPEITLPERHLGLHTAHEQTNPSALIEQIADVITQHIDLEHIWKIAQSASTLYVEPESLSIYPKATTKIAVARDKAFNFYYEDNIELLKRAGAEIVFFSPLIDSQLPSDIHGLYIGGGYPELYPEALSNNTSLLTQMQSMIEDGIPTYAECGGLMLLTEAFVDRQGQTYKLAGAISGTTTMSDKLNMGYRTITAQQDTLLLHAQETMRGHEFHYSKWDIDHTNPAYHITPRYNMQHTPEGYTHKHVLASYVHLHFASNPDLAMRFVTACNAWQPNKEGTISQ